MNPDAEIKIEGEFRSITLCLKSELESGVLVDKFQWRDNSSGYGPVFKDKESAIKWMDQFKEKK